MVATEIARGPTALRVRTSETPHNTYFCRSAPWWDETKALQLDCPMLLKNCGTRKSD